MRNKTQPIQKLLEKINKDEFEIIFHTSELTLNDMASYFNICKGEVKKLQEFWNIKWSKEEISERKKIATNRYDQGASIKKRHQTNLSLYGTKNPRAILYPESYLYDEEKSRISTDKRKKTNQEKFGADFYSQTKEWKENAIEALANTNIKKYGVRSYAQTKEFHKKAKKKYLYNNEYFDSSWELYYYIYMQDQGFDIKRNHSIEYKYICDGKEHIYFPDFILGKQVIEIKGPQYLNLDGTLKNPYGDKNQSIAISKYKCMVDNNVKILSQNELKDIISYVENKYGNKYYRKFLN